MSGREQWTAPMWNALISRQATEDGARVILTTMVPEHYRASVGEHLESHFEWRRGIEQRSQDRKQQRKRKLMEKIRGKLE